jgi:hypothetical protein
MPARPKALRAGRARADNTDPCGADSSGLTAHPHPITHPRAHGRAPLSTRNGETSCLPKDYAPRPDIVAGAAGLLGFAPTNSIVA